MTPKLLIWSDKPVDESLMDRRDVLVFEADDKAMVRHYKRFAVPMVFCFWGYQARKLKFKSQRHKVMIDNAPGQNGFRGYDSLCAVQIFLEDKGRGKLYDIEKLYTDDIAL